LLLLTGLLLSAALLLLTRLLLFAALLLLSRRPLTALLLTLLLIASLILLNIFVRIRHLKYLIVESQQSAPNYELAHYKLSKYLQGSSRLGFKTWAQDLGQSNVTVKHAPRSSSPGAMCNSPPICFTSD
jgi:hypothetical protein